MNVLVDVQLASNDETIPGTDIVESWVARAVDAADGPEATEVSVRIVDADEMRALNRDYRDMDKATNVLSFPANHIEGVPDDIPLLLGDIVVCSSVVRDEADEQEKAVADHWAHMLVHGTLHLLGYDHEKDAQAEAMESLEKQILAKYGLADPYGTSDQN